MVIVFDYQKEYSPVLGTVYRPVAVVRLIVNEIRIRERFYVDSGADLTLIPLSLGVLLGFEVGKNKIVEMGGVGGGKIPTILKSVKMQISRYEFDAKVGWALIEEVPPLLGRMGFFDNFRVSFDKREKVVVCEWIGDEM